MKLDEPQAVSLAESRAILCPMCQSAALVARHCKKICERCGYVESCEDNFLPIRSNPTDARQ
jgi:ribosomal protein S27AE